MSTNEVTPKAVSRRNALSGAATIGLGLPLLAACAGDNGGDSTATDPSESPSSTAPSEPPASASASNTKKAAPDQGIVATSEVPVGSGVVIADSEVVITQPTENEFKAFSAICTHQGCLVGDVTDTINCPCHGSMFSIEDGSPTAGPAPTPLPEVSISVDGDQISLA